MKLVDKNIQSSSDPLPYAQVDRAVKPKAATLATMLGVTYQHVMGGLLEFWESCGDPRVLEALIRKGVREVVLPREEVSGRMLVAFGKPVDLDACRHLGLLEARGDLFRVRGMSRYLGPIEARLEARAQGAIGGKLSAERRRKKFGTAQPKPEAQHRTLEGGVGGGDRTNKEALEGGFDGNGADNAEASKSPEAADSGQRSSLKASFPDEPGATVLRLEPTKAERKPKKPSRQEALFTLLAEERRQSLGTSWTADNYSVVQINTMFKDIVDFRHPETGEGYRQEAIVGAFREFLRNEYFAKGEPLFRIRRFTAADVFSEHLAKFAGAVAEVAS